MNLRRPVSWQAALVLPFAAGFIGASVSIAISRSVQAMTSDSTNARTDTSAITKGSIPVPTVSVQTVDATAAGNPARLVIPSIGINAAVQSVELSKTGSGDIGVPSNFTDVAWYDRGPVPGNPGIAIIDGHLDGRNVPEGVFYHLSDLTEGESIYVKDQAGIQQRFVVTKLQLLAYTADTSMLFAHSDTPQIALITCAGDWLPDKHEYTDRVVVFATLANQDP